MRVLAWLGLTAVFAFSQAPAAPKGCDPAGNVQFICGVISPEDLVAVPGSDWVVASGDAAGGAITLINTRDKTTMALFPSASPKLRLRVPVTVPGKPPVRRNCVPPRPLPRYEVSSRTSGSL